MADSKSVSVEIFGQRYPIRSTLDEEYIKRLAAYVDGKIRAAGDTAPSGDPVRLAVLAALNIADEMFTMRQKQQQIEGPLRKRVEKCVSLVEKALEQSN